MNVLLIDDHPLILAALQTLVQGLGEQVDVVAVASARQARETLAATADFDMALLDLQLGDEDGFDLLAELRASYPALPIVVVAASDHRDDVMRAIDLGAMGFVPKCSANAMLMDALKMVMSGGIYLPSSVMRSPSQPRAHSRTGQPHVWDGALDDERAAATLETLALTPRQKEVLALLLRGQSNKLIARALNLSVETIKDHVAAVLRTLKVSSRTQAVVAVSQMSNPQAFAGWRERQHGVVRLG
ncbi:MAG: response regulator transcription factor [Pseudomonadota bacterium]|nr:response regulator transcription factor [Pseudomonadota bacterium]